MLKTAIVLGATGLTGGLLTQLLLRDPSFSKVKLFTRRKTSFKHPKIQEIICDLLDINTFKNTFDGDVVFCCVGTTKAQTPDKKKYHDIDYGIPIQTARLALQKDIPTYIVVSSIGSTPHSPFFYPRTKGEMERDLRKLGIANTYILKPAFINGRPDEARQGEKILKMCMALMDFFMIGPLKKWKSTPALAIAKAMVQLTHTSANPIVIKNSTIKTLSSAYRV